MARRYNGTSDKIVVAVGGCNFADTFSLITLCRFDTARNATWNAMSSSFASGGGFQGFASERTNTNKVNLTTDNVSSADSTTTTQASDGWCLHAVCKAAGNATPVYKRYKYSTNVFVSENMNSFINDGTAPGGSGTIEIGGDFGGATDWFAADALLFAIVHRNISTAEFQNLPFTIQAFYNLPNLAMLVMLDQDTVSQKICDLIGTSNESSRTGTTVPTDANGSCPVFNYTDGFIFQEVATVATALEVQAVPCSFTADSGTNSLSESLQAVVGSTTFSSLVSVALAPQAVPASTSFGVATPKLAEQLQAVVGNVAFSSLVSLQSALQAVPGSFTASAAAASLLEQLQAVVGSTTFSVAAPALAEKLQAVVGSVAFSSLVGAQFAPQAKGTTTFSIAVPSLAENLQAVPGNTNFSGLASLSGGLVTTPGSCTYSALDSVALAAQAKGTTTFSAPAPSLAAKLQATPGSVLFDSVVDVVGLPLQVTSPAARVNYSGLASLAESLSAVPGNSTFTGNATAEMSATPTTVGGFTAEGGAVLGYAYSTSPGSVTFDAATALRGVEIVAVPPATSVFSVPGNVLVIWDTGLISGYVTMRELSSATAILTTIAANTAKLENFEAAQALLRNRVE